MLDHRAGYDEVGRAVAEWKSAGCCISDHLAAEQRVCAQLLLGAIQHDNQMRTSIIHIREERALLPSPHVKDHLASLLV